MSIRDGARVNVSSTGLGNAGNINFQARSISFDQGTITAATTSGEGGGIFLRSRSLQLRNGSNITATAGGTGNGGSININTDLLSALQGSKITADAVAGRGGNIKIDTSGLFQSPDSPITASSQLGIDGTVQINTLITQPASGTLELPQQTIDQSKLVVQACPGNVPGKSSSFTVTGRGGKALTPFDPLEADPTTPLPRKHRNNTQLPPLQDPDPLPKHKIQSLLQNHQFPLIEANSWQFDAQGNIVLFASTPTAPPLPTPQCQALQ